MLMGCEMGMLFFFTPIVSTCESVHQRSVCTCSGQATKEWLLLLVLIVHIRGIWKRLHACGFRNFVPLLNYYQYVNNFNPEWSNQFSGFSFRSCLVSYFSGLPCRHTVVDRYIQKHVLLFKLMFLCSFIPEVTE